MAGVRAPARERERIRVEVESLDLDANGVARHDGKVVFVRGALPGEVGVAEILRRKPRYDVAQLVSLERESNQRVVPRCPHYGVCGGCSMQHMHTRGQLATKQRALEDQLWHIGKLHAQVSARAIAGPAWGYRFRARLSVRDVPGKGGVLVGFHERGSSFVADMRECHVLPPRVSALLVPLRGLVESLSIRARLPQIEVAVGQRAPIDLHAPEGWHDAAAPVGAGAASDSVVALVLRILEPLTGGDEDRVAAFAAEHDLEIWLQTKGPETITLFAAGAQRAPGASALGYRLPEFGLWMPYRPTDFTQVNHRVNEVLVGRAVRLLDPQPGERVGDLFCGIGNFTLALATRAAQVLGVEGAATLIERASENARINGLSDRVRFQVANLFALGEAGWAQLGHFDRLLIDPPREGAIEVALALAENPRKPRRIVYVSCNPATLARDAEVLVHRGGFVLASAGAVNMFPHTSHVESIAVFEPAAGA